MNNSKNELARFFEEIIDGGELVRVIFSRKRKATCEYSKVTMRPVSVKGALLYQLEYAFDKKVTHENADRNQIVDKCLKLVNDDFKQINAVTMHEDIQVLANKPEKPRITRSCKEHSVPDFSHDRKKSYIIPEGVPCDFLIHLGVMDDKGKVYKKYYSKFRQINRFLEIVDDTYPVLAENGDLSVSESDNEKEPVSAAKPLKIIDFGCGKAYLTFALYYYFVKLKKIPCQITGLDLKDDVIRFCEKTARELDYDGLRFEIGDIADYSDDSADMVVTLHACDTATDYALINAVKWNTKVILSVPCCQHELFKQIKNDVNGPMLKHGIIKDKFTELLTDGLRGLKLEAGGYDVAMMEFTSLEHTSKNIMIKAVKTRTPDAPASKKAEEEYKKLRDEYNVSPTIGEL